MIFANSSMPATGSVMPLAVPTLEFLGTRFHTCNLEEAVAALAGWSGTKYRYVVTPNVDHIVRLNGAPDSVQHVYREADLCLCDSRILTFLARLRGLHLPTVSGSDLTVALLKFAIQPNDTVNVVGGDDMTCDRLRAMLPGINIRHHQPPMGLLADPDAMQAAAAFVADNPARWTLLAVGSPQQELIAHQVRDTGRGSGTALCIGASIAFLTGQKRRAPLIMRRMGLEWLHRLLSEPRRLWVRYLVRAPRIFVIFVRWHPAAINPNRYRS